MASNFGFLLRLGSIRFFFMIPDLGVSQSYVWLQSCSTGAVGFLGALAQGPASGSWRTPLWGSMGAGVVLERHVLYARFRDVGCADL